MTRPTLPEKALLANRYQIVALEGQGSMGAVYRGFDRELNRTVALKSIAHRSPSDEQVQKALQEARVLAAMSHPNIMQIFDVVTENESVWLVTEWISGSTLAQIEKPLEPAVVTSIMTQVFQALAAAHQANVYHRDIKPANIMIDQDGRVTLLDFGVAFNPVSSTGQTMAGSLRYTDPRLLEGIKPDEQSDMFSAALLMLELLTGETVLPDLAPLPLYRHITEQLDDRVEDLCDGQYPPLAELAKFYLRPPSQVQPDKTHGEVARLAAVRCQELLQALTPMSAEYYLFARARGERKVQKAVQRSLSEELKQALASKNLSPKLKAAWMAYGLANSHIVQPKPKRFLKMLPVRLPAKVLSMGGTGVVLALLILGGLKLYKASQLGTRHSQNPVALVEPLDSSNPATPLDQVPTVNESLEEKTQITIMSKPSSGPNKEAAVDINRNGQATRIDSSNSGDEPTDKAPMYPVYIVANMWADVSVDGVARGRLPNAKPFKLTAGVHKLRLESPISETLEATIKVVPGDVHRLKFSLQPRKTVRTVQLAREGRLYIDGVDLGIVKKVTLPLDLRQPRSLDQAATASVFRAKDLSILPDTPVAVNVIEERAEDKG